VLDPELGLFTASVYAFASGPGMAPVFRLIGPRTSELTGASELWSFVIDPEANDNEDAVELRLGSYSATPLTLRVGGKEHALDPPDGHCVVVQALDPYETYVVKLTAAKDATILTPWVVQAQVDAEDIDPARVDLAPEAWKGNSQQLLTPGGTITVANAAAFQIALPRLSAGLVADEKLVLEVAPDIEVPRHDPDRAYGIDPLSLTDRPRTVCVTPEEDLLLRRRHRMDGPRGPTLIDLLNRRNLGRAALENGEPELARELLYECNDTSFLKAVRQRDQRAGGPDFEDSVTSIVDECRDLLVDAAAASRRRPPANASCSLWGPGPIDSAHLPPVLSPPTTEADERHRVAYLHEIGEHHAATSLYRSWKAAHPSPAPTPPRSDEAMDRAVDKLLTADQFDELLDLLTAYQPEHPTCIRCAEWRARAYANLDRWPEAREQFRIYAETAPDPTDPKVVEARKYADGTEGR
jgi:hypothetical protein